MDLAERQLSFDVGKLAKQANAAVVATYGETMLLVTAVISDKPREGLDFFPLLVDYEERFYAAGKIPGGFIKREGRPSESAILSARGIDRSIRSLFPEWLRNDVHVVATVLSFDQTNPPNVLAINAASAALTLSEIPFDGPIGAVRIGYLDGELVVNPSEERMKESKLDLLVAGHKGGITMVEAGAQEVSESLMVDALERAQEEIRKIVDLQLEMREAVGKPKMEIAEPPRYPEIDEWIDRELWDSIYRAVQIHEKKPRALAISHVTEEAWSHFKEAYPDAENYVSEVVDSLVKKGVRKLILEEGRRADGRGMDEVRPISCETGLLPRAHGSALFTRGETQALVVTTLGMIGQDEQILDGLKWEEPAKQFMLQYNFPPYSVGEIKPMRGPGRREIGHGALAERALRPMMPEESAFPYVVRVVSDILESNGSSSMASVCGGSLSLMDAGVPLKSAVAGVAMGLITDGTRYGILTDIQGLEDHYGDMDFKVAGTRQGITALQMDNKAGGITREILERALEQARQGRLHILDIMDSALPEARKELSPNAPRILTLTIDQEKIRDIIGPGGKTIRSIIQQTGAKVDVEDDGRVFISANAEDAAQKALKIIDDLTREVKAGDVFIGKVTRLMNFGVFVEVLPGKEGLLHVSEISTHHIPKVEDAFAVGDRVLVQVKEIDEMGRINLTRRRFLEDPGLLRENPEYEAQFEAEEEREDRYATLLPGESSGNSGSSRGEGRDRGDRKTSDRRNGRRQNGTRGDRRS